MKLEKLASFQSELIFLVKWSAEPILTYDQWGSVAFTEDQNSQKYSKCVNS